jgi:hypothetical protein
MKYIYALPAALMLLLVSCKDDKDTEATIDPKKTDLYAFKLNGKVKSLSERSFSYKGAVKGDPAGESSRSGDTDWEFDEKGMAASEINLSKGKPVHENTYKGRKNPVKEIQYVNGSPGIISEHTYDKNGNLSAKIRKTGKNEQIDRIENKYQGKNLVEKNTFNNQNTPIDKITYAYDKNGNMTEENIYMGTHAVKVRVKYEYNKENQKVLESHYNQDKLTDKTVYAYDGKKLVSKVTLNANNEVEYSEKYAYDAKGNITKFIQFEKYANSETEELRTYDANSNLISAVSTVKDKVNYKELYAYDKNNNVVSIMVTNGDGQVLDNRNYAYTYDGNKNWTKKVVHIMGQPAFVVERNIKYYK